MSYLAWLRMALGVMNYAYILVKFISRSIKAQHEGSGTLFMSQGNPAVVVVN
jgi:uncharacterized membrane protein YidH (DUF202 family)